ncbi:AMP-binding protein [uncultured Jatrophihabitans sp.]|uniref:AMP-binding protein n=1 Tax=uncultured Jatrophihabitans sp. TaxID=1610747 RepID=UPI0035CA871E
MSTPFDVVGPARRLLERAGFEASYAATLLQARGPGLALTPPHKLLATLRDVVAYGPAGAAISFAAASYGDHPAIVDELGQVSFAELDRRSSALASALRDAGFRDGDGLGVLARNHRYLFETIFAGAKLGARTLLLNTDFAGPQLADVCDREDVTALVHDSEFTEVAESVEPSGGKYIAWSDDEHGDGSDEHTVEQLITSAQSGRPPRPKKKQKIILLTSGTTGTPKGAPRDMSLSLALPGGYLSKIPLRSGRAVVLAAPGFHAWGLLSSMLSLGLGNTLVTARKTDAKFILDALEEHSADALISVPILLARLLDAGEDEIDGHDLSALRVIAVSGSALPTDLAQRTMDAFGDILYNLYGSTEVAYATIATPADMRAAPGTVGKPPLGTRIKLFDEDEHEVPQGESGRIFVGSSMQFEGYTGGGSKTIIDGMMSTGDMGHLDEHGRLFVDGRDDDMIVSGGENVFPAEVEELLGTYDGVEEAAVVGVDDDDYGKRLRAYVVLADGADSSKVDEKTLKDHVKSNLARYKVPREIVFIDEMPRNPAGKVMKRKLPGFEDSADDAAGDNSDDNSDDSSGDSSGEG